RDSLSPLFISTAPAPVTTSPLSLHDALPILNACVDLKRDNDVAIIIIENPPVNALKHEVRAGLIEALKQIKDPAIKAVVLTGAGDRKSTRLNSSHGSISYAVFCLKKKNKKKR